MKKRLLTVVALLASVVSVLGAVGDTIDIKTSQLPYKTENIFGCNKVYRLTVDEIVNIAVSVDYKEFSGSKTSGFVAHRGTNFSVKGFTAYCGTGYIEEHCSGGAVYLIRPFFEDQVGIPYVLKIDKLQNIKYNSDYDPWSGIEDTIKSFPFVETGNAEYYIDKTTAGVTVRGTKGYILKGTGAHTVFHIKSKHGLLINSNVVWDRDYTLSEGEEISLQAITTDDEYDIVVDIEDACPLIAEKVVSLPFEGTMKPNIVCNQEDNYGYFYQAYTFNLEEESFIKASTTSGDFEIQILNTEGEKISLAGNNVSGQKLSVGKYYLVQYGKYNSSAKVELKTIGEDEFTDRNEEFEVTDLPFDSELIIGKTTYGEINVAKDTFVSNYASYAKSFFVHLEAGKAYNMVANVQTKATSKNSYYQFMVAKDLTSEVDASGVAYMGLGGSKAESGQFGVTETGDYIVLLVYETKQDGQYSILVEEEEANARYLVFGEEEQETVGVESEVKWSFYVPQDTVIEISLKSEPNNLYVSANDKDDNFSFRIESTGDYKVRLSRGMYDLHIENSSSIKPLTYQLSLNICGEKVKNDTCTFEQLLADAELTDGFALKALSRDCAPVKYIASSDAYMVAYKMELKEGETVSVYYSCDLYTLEDEAAQTYKKVKTLSSSNYKVEKDEVYYFVFEVSYRDATASISLRKETNVMSLEDYLATLSDVSLAYTDTFNFDFSKKPLVDFGSYKEGYAYYCVGYKLNLNSDDVFLAETSIWNHYFFIKETESGLEIIDDDEYRTFSKKIESTGVYYLVFAALYDVWDISDVVSMSVTTKDIISLETLLSQAETLEGDSSFTLNYGSEETSLVLGDGIFGEAGETYYSKAFKIDLKGGQTLMVKHENVELDDYTYFFDISSSGITMLGDFDDYEHAYASYTAEYAGTVYLVLSTYSPLEQGTSDYQIDIVEENISSIEDAVAGAEVLNDRGKNIKVVPDVVFPSSDGYIYYPSKIYKKEMLSGQTVIFYAEQPCHINLFNIVDGEEKVIDYWNIRSFNIEHKYYVRFTAAEAGMYYFKVTPTNSSSIQMSYDFVIDYADYVASSEISTSSFHDVDSLIPFQSPLVDAGTEEVRLSKMHTFTFENQTAILYVQKGDVSSYTILPESEEGYDLVDSDTMVVSYKLLDAGTYNFAAKTIAATNAIDDREVKVDYKVYPIQTMDTFPYCDAKEIDLTYIYDRKSLLDDDDVVLFSTPSGYFSAVKAMKVRLEEGEQIVFADNIDYPYGLVCVEIFGVDNGEYKDFASFTYSESKTFSYVAQEGGYYYISYSIPMEMIVRSVTSFTIKKADAEVVPIVKMTPSVDYVSSGEVDVKAAVLMALADVNAVAETEEGKTFLIDNTNITWTLNEDLTMATGVVACPEDYSIENEEIAILSVDLNPSFVTITTDGNGTVDNETIKVHRGSTASVNVKAKEGFNVAEITVDGEVVGNNLVGMSGGTFEFTANETYLNIYVKFQPVKTSVEEVLSQNVNVYGGEQVINIVNARVGSPVVVYNLTGAVVKQTMVHSDVETISVAKAGLYIVKVDYKAVKVIVR